MSTTEAIQQRIFLPDFCDFRVVFGVVIIGELLAFVLVLSPVGDWATWWRDLALTSLFIQWVGLSSAGLLCPSRRHLEALGNQVAGVVGYVVVLLVTIALSEAAYWLVAHRVVSLPVQSAWQVGSSTYWFDQPRPVAVALPSGWHFEFLLRNLAISAIVTAVALRYFYIQHQRTLTLAAESRARIQALQSRIRPHFLFNSMNTIASLTRTRPEVAEQVTEDLAELFRASLADASIPSTLADEMEICRQYLRIEEQRLGERLRAALSVDDRLGRARLPRLTLQPLVENSVYHGVEPMPEGGTVRVSAEQQDNRLCLRISNPLSAAQKLANAQIDLESKGASGSSPAARRGGNHMAQENVALRLRAFFDDSATLRVRMDGNEYVVELEFPYWTQDP